MSRIKPLLVVSLILVAAPGCIPSYRYGSFAVLDRRSDAIRLVKTGGAPVHPEAVRVFSWKKTIDRPYLRLGTILLSYKDVKVDEEMILAGFRAEAAKLGANALILEERTDEESWAIVMVVPIPGKRFRQRATAIYLKDLEPARKMEEGPSRAPTATPPPYLSPQMGFPPAGK